MKKMSLTKKRHHLIMDETDVMKVITVLNKYKIYRNISIGNCGWADTSKWFIHFDASFKSWRSIVKELNVVRIWECCSIPKDTGLVYSED